EECLMRKNLPVTDIGRTFSVDKFLVSKTDTKGVITYCNKQFIELAGYEEEELLGAPHNIVRHPDMPEAAFADLWRTVQSGREWQGIVKNRCKNGDYYWVDAQVTPSFNGSGDLVGYMSVRRKPTQDQIDSAVALYAQMRTEEGR
ncbi:MAG: PAS domain-containing protein, partial [Mariprofundales bacterium]|nr:PAS domain-containing protein [Mariprofundales bacterium]